MTVKQNIFTPIYYIYYRILIQHFTAYICHTLLPSCLSRLQNCTHLSSNWRWKRRYWNTPTAGSLAALPYHQHLQGAHCQYPHIVLQYSAPLVCCRYFLSLSPSVLSAVLLESIALSACPTFQLSFNHAHTWLNVQS